MPPMDEFKWRINNLKNGFIDFESVLPATERRKKLESYETQLQNIRTKSKCAVGNEEECLKKLRPVR